MTVKILIGADICPTHANVDLFAKADVKALVGGEALSLLEAADYTVFNLETPLTDEITPVIKNGPCLRAPVCTINGLKAINPHFFTLANNHILDQGVQGLNSTIHLLKQAGIAYSGVGENLEQASKSYIAEIKGIKLGIYCCAEHEFSIATETEPGANPYDPLTSFEAVRDLKKQTDFVIVLYHGGKEHYRYPSVQLQRIFRKFADCGAGLVVAQHTHCIGCMEKYQDSTLVYGQGNFLFTSVQNEYWDSSLLIQVELEVPAKKCHISYLPCVRHGSCIRLAGKADAHKLLTDFETRSKQIQVPGFIEENYRKFALTLLDSYLQGCTGKLGQSLFMRALNKVFGDRLFRCLYTPKDLVRLQNTLDCEAHREVFLQGLQEKIK